MSLPRRSDLTHAPPTCPDAMPKGPPHCANPDCRTESTCLETAKLRETWQADDGYKWFWHTEKAAYWTYCLHCHNRLFPEDKRVANRYSQPRAAFALKLACSTGRAFIGEFYLTSPPPELMPARPLPRLGAPTDARSRSPRRLCVASETALPLASGTDSWPLLLPDLPECCFAAVLSPPRRSCFKGARGHALDLRVNLGDEHERRSVYPACGPLSREPRFASLWEEFHVWHGPDVLCTAENNGDDTPYHWPGTCEIEGCLSRFPAGLDRGLYQRHVVASCAPSAVLISFVCAPCYTHMRRGVSLRLRPEVFGAGVKVEAWFRKRTRLAHLHGCAAAMGPRERAFTPKIFGGGCVVRPIDDYCAMKLHLQQHLAAEVALKGAKLSQDEEAASLRSWCHTLTTDRQRRDAEIAVRPQAPPSPTYADLPMPACGQYATGLSTPPEQLAGTAQVLAADDAPLTELIPAHFQPAPARRDRHADGQSSDSSSTSSSSSSS